MTDYQKRVLAQTEAWVNGTSLHNIIDDECCPDFSCCRSDMFEESIDRRRDRFLKLQVRYGSVQ